MAPKLDLEARMTIKKLHEKQVPKARIARILGVSEGSVRYHLKRQAEGAGDGRKGRQPHLALAYRGAIEAWLEGLPEGSGLNLAALHDYLVEEFQYPGSLRSLQRYFRAYYPKPKIRARRRVETPPGAQSQADWAHFPRVWVRGGRRDLYAFLLKLSHSRHKAVVWSESKDQLSWHQVHNESFRRLEGVPAVVRVDNEKTAVEAGAGAWGRLNRAYRQYARIVRLPIDPCPPRSPEFKGKVERGVRETRGFLDPYRNHWNSLEELQEWTDEKVLRESRKRICPATGATRYETWREEIRYLAPLPILPEPFDLVRRNKVGIDGLVSFEGRRYSVPFSYVGQTVEVRGCAGTVQVLKDARVVAVHPRHTPERILVDPSHYEGEATDQVQPPTPLGKMGRRLQEIARMEPEKRPVDLYAALAEVSR